MTDNEIIRRLKNIRRRLSMNTKDDIENEKALESAIEIVKGVTSGAIVPIEWHEIKTRPLTDEERAAIEYCDFDQSNIDDGCDYMLECHMPDDDETVLISIYGRIMIDVFHRDDCCWFEDFDICDVKAWAHLPKPFEKT